MTTDKQKLFEAIGLELDKIDNKNIKDAFIVLFNIIEENVKVINILKEENQKLKDEINRLKGEQGKPDIKPKNKNISSEKERKKQKRKKKKKGSKKDRLKIDKIENAYPVVEQLDIEEGLRRILPVSKCSASISND